MDQQISEIDQKLERIIQILSNKQEQEIDKARRKEERRKEILKKSNFLFKSIGFILFIILLLNAIHVFEPGVASLILASVSVIIGASAFIISMLNVGN